MEKKTVAHAAEKRHVRPATTLSRRRAQCRLMGLGGRTLPGQCARVVDVEKSVPIGLPCAGDQAHRNCDPATKRMVQRRAESRYSRVPARRSATRGLQSLQD